MTTKPHIMSITLSLTLVKSPKHPAESQPLASASLESYSGASTVTEVKVPASTIAAFVKEDREETATAVDTTEASIRMLFRPIRRPQQSPTTRGL